MNNDLSLDSGTGLAGVLNGNRLSVPVNQREYKWSRDNVVDMLQDLANAMKAQRASYFMGTIVMTRRSDEEWEVADGQQRLATTTIILCVIRDIFLKMGEEKRARSFEQDFIFWIDPESAEEVARLTLNVDDNDFFYHQIVLRPDVRKPTLAKLSSHKLLVDAYQAAYDYFDGLQQQVGKGFTESLLQWRKYLLNSAKVLVLKVPDATWAFTMFETLNDRGIKTSQVDLVKNHLFQEAGKRIDEAQHAWSAMRGAIESISDRDDVLIEYVRWAACLLYGMTREKEVFDRVSEHSHGSTDSMTMLSALEQMANDYVAIFNPEHPKWNTYPPQIRIAIRTLSELDVRQMRPLVLSAARNFSPSELLKTYRGLISWAVRMSIAGGTKAGRLDTFYANLAYEVNTGKIKTYKALLGATGQVIPTDAEFQSYFETLRVKVSKTARYYLRSLEQTAKGMKGPAQNPNEDTNAVNLEHVMPRTLSEAWKASEQDLETHAHRLGNLALLEAAENVVADKAAFVQKKSILAKSPFLLTKMIGEHFDKWGIEEIENRQKKLAEYAPTTWPVVF